MMIWIDEAVPSGPFRLVVCASSDAGLYVLIEGPPPQEQPGDDGPDYFELTAQTTTGERLDFQRFSRTGGKTSSTYLGQFAAPDTPERLRLRLAAGDRELFEATAIPVHFEPA